MERVDRFLVVSFFVLLGIACLEAPFRLIRSGEVSSHSGTFWGFGLLGISLVTVGVYCVYRKPVPRFSITWRRRAFPSWNACVRVHGPVHVHRRSSKFAPMIRKASNQAMQRAAGRTAF
jgi:hypothetical protein